jgi:ElaB/YqjD/DUF883 family membrane-anchored ribosome-binding protein
MSQYRRTSDMDETTNKFERGAGNLRSAARDAADAGQDAAESAGRKASNFAAETAESVSDLASEARDSATDMAHRGMDYAQSYASRIEEASRRNPLGAIATALFAGIAIGYLTRGRH